MNQYHQHGGSPPRRALKAELRLSESLQVTAVNEDYYVLFPCKSDKPEGLALSELVPGDQGKALELLLASAATNREAFSFQFPLSCGGEMINCGCEFTPSENGGTLLLQPVNYISSSETFRRIVQNSPLGIIIIRGKEIIYVNRAVEQISGLTAEEVLKLEPPFTAIVYEEDREKLKSFFEQWWSGQQPPGHMALRFYTREKQLRWSEIWITHTLLEGERVMQVSFIDVTERKRAEAQLQETTANMQAIFNNNLQAMLLLDTEGKIIEYNFVARQFGDLMGWPELTPGTPFLDVVPPSNRTDYFEHFSQASNGEVYTIERTFTYDEGKKHLLIHYIPVLGRENEVTSICLTALDITQLKEAQRAFEESEKAFRGIYERVTTGLYRTDVDGNVLMANPAFARILGYPSAEKMLPFSIPDSAYKDKAKRFDFVKLVEQEGTVKDHQAVWKKRDGDDLYVLKNAVAVFDDAGELQFIDGSVQDVTERYKTMHELIESRAQLRALTAHIQAVREEERTAISREVHDEVGQVMSSLMLNLSMLTKELEASSVENLKELVENELRSMSRVIEKSVKKLKSEIAALRPQELETLGLLPAVEELLNDYRTKIPLEIDFECNDEQIPAAGDVALAVYRIVQEALTNIVRHSGADHVSVKLRKNNRWLTVTVDDNGCGIKGAGLNGSSSFGLLGMRERAIILGGSLKIASSPSGGVSIQLTVPLHQ